MKIDDDTPILALRHRHGEPFGEYQLLLSLHRSVIRMKYREHVTAVEVNADLERLSRRRFTVEPVKSEGAHDDEGVWFCSEWDDTEQWEVVWFYVENTPQLHHLRQGMDEFRYEVGLGPHPETGEPNPFADTPRRP